MALICTHLYNLYSYLANKKHHHHVLIFPLYYGHKYTNLYIPIVAQVTIRVPELLNLGDSEREMYKMRLSEYKERIGDMKAHIQTLERMIESLKGSKS